MAFTEFYCQSGGSNLNSGSDTNNAAKYTSTNGNWNSTTNVFIPTDGTNPVAAGVVVGDFASVYVDGATVGVYIARVSAVVNATNGAITIAPVTGGAGTAPSTSTTARTMKVGGAWKGPNGAVGFPFTLVNLGRLRNLSGGCPRINLKNDATYLVSVAVNVAPTQPDPFFVQGYGSTLGDLSKAKISCGTTSISVFIANSGGGLIHFADLIFESLATSGGSVLVQAVSARHGFFRCVFTGARAGGLQVAAASIVFECEAYNCNQSGTTGTTAGFQTSGEGASFIRCYSHGHVGSSGHGFGLQSGATLIECIAASCGGNGVITASFNSSVGIKNCDFYKCTGDAIGVLAGTSPNYVWLIENCNFVKNGRAINIPTNAAGVSTGGYAFNCGYGAGTMANTNPDVLGFLVKEGAVTYASGVTPWLDPDNGKFDLVLATAISVGRDSFTTTQGTTGPTTSFEDIGAASADGTPFGGSAGAAILPDGFIGRLFLWEAFYNVDISVTISAGVLPPGLALSQPTTKSYEITGVPTTVGTYDFAVRHSRGPNHIDVTFRINVLVGFGTGGAGEGEGEAGPTVLRMPHASVSVRDPEISSLIRRSKRALQALSSLSMTGEGVSGDVESGFMLND
jgi:hypothetical protein